MGALDDERDQGAAELELEPGPPWAPRGDDDDERRPPAAEPGAELAVDDEEPLEPVTEEQVRSGLRAQGLLLHGFVAVEPDSDEWKWLEDELDLIAPPLTRVVNRVPVLQRLAHAGDFLAILAATGAYGGRSMRTRGRGLARARAAAEAEQPGGVIFEVPEA